MSKKINLNKLGKKLRQLRLERRLSQQEVANFVGIHFATLARYESGERLPDVNMLKKLADFFGVTMDDLMDDEIWDITANPEDILPDSIKAWLRMTGNEFSPEEQEMLVEDLTDYFRMKRERIIKNRRKKENKQGN